MDEDDFQDALAAVVTAIRVTLRTELSSIWLPVQLGTIALVAAAALAAGVSTGVVSLGKAALVAKALLVAAAPLTVEVAALAVGAVPAVGGWAGVLGATMGRQGRPVPMVLKTWQGAGAPMTMGSPRNLGPLSST